MRAVLCTDWPLLDDVLHFLFTEAGLKVVDRTSDPVALLTSVAHLRPDIVVLASTDPVREPGICSHLLNEYPDLKLVILSSDHYAIADVGIRVRRFSNPSVESIHALAESLLTD